MYLYDLISGKGEEWNVGGVASHEITVQDTENALMSNDQEIVLFTFQFENDGFQTDSDIVVRLQHVSH